MHNRCSSYCITSFITQGYSCHFLTNTCFQQWWMFLKQYCNTSWFQTARLLLGTGKTVYTFLHQTCEAYLLVVRLQKGVKKKKVGKGIRRNFSHAWVFLHFQTSPKLTEYSAQRILSKLQVLLFKNSSQTQGSFSHQLGKTQ